MLGEEHGHRVGEVVTLSECAEGGALPSLESVVTTFFEDEPGAFVSALEQSLE